MPEKLWNARSLASENEKIEIPMPGVKKESGCSNESSRFVCLNHHIHRFFLKILNLG